MGCRNSEDSSRSYFSVRSLFDEDPCLSMFLLEISDGLIGGGGWLGSGRDPSMNKKLM